MEISARLVVPLNQREDRRVDTVRPLVSPCSRTFPECSPSLAAMIFLQVRHLPSSRRSAAPNRSFALKGMVRARPLGIVASPREFLVPVSGPPGASAALVHAAPFGRKVGILASRERFLTRRSNDSFPHA